MSIEQALYRLKLTSAVVIDGAIRVADEIVELAEREARDLLRREKAIPHDGAMADQSSGDDAVLDGLADELKSATQSLDEAVSSNTPEDAPAAKSKKK